jgi:hypothetical protein
MEQENTTEVVTEKVKGSKARTSITMSHDLYDRAMEAVKVQKKHKNMSDLIETAVRLYMENAA